MRKGRLMIFALVASFALAVGGSALAAGPSGSTDTGEASCAGGESADNPDGGSVLTVYADSNGVETCSDDNLAPDGRIMVSFADGYVAADGDDTNPEPLNGWIRFDSGGVTCGNGDKDASDGGGSPDNCG